MNYTGQTSFAEMFEYYCTRNVTNEREYNEREMMRWAKQQLAQAHREGWEQGKQRAEDIANNIDACAGDCSGYSVISDAIAAMEYREKAND